MKKERLSELQGSLKDPTRSYAQIGHEFGVSRQRISQVAQMMKINGRARQRERDRARPPRLTDRGAYPLSISHILNELVRQKIEFSPYHRLRKPPDRAAYKILRMILINGVLCRIGARSPKKHVAFVPFPVTPEILKAQAVVWGVTSAEKLRLYVIPVREIEHVRFVCIPVNGKYSRRWREPMRDWTAFQDAWHLLCEQQA